MATYRKQHIPLSTIKDRIGQLAAELILYEAKSQRFGVILRDIEPINPAVFVETALKHRKSAKLSLRIAIPDPNLGTVIPEIQARMPDSAEFLANTEEEIVAWRNEHLRTIAVLTNKPLARGASLRDFEIRDDQDAIRMLANQKSEEASTAFLRNFWKALAHDQAPDDFRLQDVIRFALELESLGSHDDQGLQLKNVLPTLGLLKDSRIADKNTPADIANTNLMRGCIE